MENLPFFLVTLTRNIRSEVKYKLNSLNRIIIKIDKDKTHAISFSHRLRPLEAHLTLNRWNILFVSHVKYLGVIFDKRITWRLHIEMIEAKAFRTFIRIYYLFRHEHLSASIY
jgi:hypothetical protein